MLPFIFLQVAPFVTVMAAIFCITRLRRSNELIPMIVSGRSLYRVLLPVFVFAIVLAIGMGLVQQYVAPGLADKRSQIKELLFEGKAKRLVSGQFRIGPTSWVRVIDYDVDRRRIGAFDVTDITTTAPSQTGRDAKWDEEQSRFVYMVEVPDDRGKLAQYLYERTGKPKW
jgi:lipopolysaccharide export LptBFGC system permease protein LptF